jgi:SWI/SNF-related matrix-associated actin-dependent regulator of chromatin subfamily A member 5
MKRTSSRLSKGSLEDVAVTPVPVETSTRKAKEVNYAEPSDDESDSMSVESAGGDAAETKAVPKVLRNSIPMHEVERSSIDRLVQLSRYRTIFEPFITPKVMKQLNDVLINKPTVGEDEKAFSPQLITQPYCMAPTCKMRSYQLEGLSFLVNNYHRSINCILADEMGLGKTLQSISCIAHLAIVKKLSGPYLVIVPLSVLFNWINEFKKWCPQLKVVRLHSLDKDEQLRLRKVLHNPDIAQVVVTTYDTIKTGGLSHALRSMVWRAAFLDEGHRIKNENSEVSKACHGLRTRFRVILTGTPVQNNLHEFGALLSFLAPNIFTNLELFDAAFALKVSKVDKSPKKHHRSHSISNDSDAGKSGADAEGASEAPRTAQQIDRALLASAHYMMKPFVLRRLKSEVEQKLPPKYETKINCPMTDIQKDLTRALLFKEQALLSKLDGKRWLIISLSE